AVCQQQSHRVRKAPHRERKEIFTKPSIVSSQNYQMEVQKNEGCEFECIRSTDMFCVNSDFNGLLNI
ncbi:MAG: hypothetical protein KKE00_05650, partial [Proteobacteria bacterium]|nr:hypothetical protein [Pseudomonadota bacterium]